MRHIVQQGETLYSIARKYNLSASELLSINELSPSVILQPGQALYTSRSNGAQEGQSAYEYTVQSGDTLYTIGKRFGISPQEILRVNGLSAHSGIYIGQKLVVRTMSSPNQQTVPPPMPQSTEERQIRFYTVQQGDSLYKIAEKFQTTPETILKNNDLAMNATIYIGQRLRIAVTAANTPTVDNTPVNVTVYTIQSGDSLYSISQRFEVTPADILDANGLAADAAIYIGQSIKIPQRKPQNTPTINRPDPKPQTKPGEVIHTVQAGEWLAKIAKEYGVPAEAIIESNSLTGNSIYIGQHLVIPAKKQTMPAHLQAQADRIRKVRAQYQIEINDGNLLFGKGLRGPITPTGSIYAEDLEKVQQRLISLGFLSEGHGESAQRLSSQTGGEIWGRNIPETLSAIRQVQQRYKLEWWVGTDSRRAMLGNGQYTPGAITPNDATYTFLKDYAEVKLQFTHPTTGQPTVAEFSNFCRSGYNVYHKGVGYRGSSTAETLPLSLFQEVGLNASLAEAVKYVSEHEGNFDAINSYDKAFFSYGFIQFAGGGRGFGPLLARMKVNEPELFKTYFQDAGIDVTYTTRNGDIHQGELHLFDLQGSQGEYTVSGEAAEKALRADYQLYGVFMKAGYHPAFIKCQLEQAVKAYVKPALGIKLDITVAGNTYQDIPITDIINSPMGLSFVIDMTVNKWITKTAQLFEDAINEICQQYGYQSPAQVKSIDERLVLQTIIGQNGDDGRIVKRGNNILNGTLASSKNPSAGGGLLA
ncbi:muramidase family protein [Algivirga pacifica]|uniref:LysM domain-containing protein n=1 Tax=Algivirga pacifica TaxID=1162670 RepID=A0ABP9D2A3_9BACT